MPKFSGPAAPPANIFAPITTTGARALTAEGHVGHLRDAKSELFLLAVTNMVGEATFYEAAGDRDSRFLSLVHQVTAEDPEWVLRLIPFLRDRMNMRSASVVAAAEYVRAKGPNGRRAVLAACSRPDEPGELLGYWLSNYGRALPQPLKRGLADAAVKFYSERSLLKYDGQSKTIRFADVIEFAHPKPRDAAQAALFRHALDRRHGHDETIPEGLRMLDADRFLMQMPEGGRRHLVVNTPEVLHRAGWTWERLSGWLPGGMDAEAWEAVIPQMGYMALLRNLRNFDDAGISDAVRDQVIAKLTDPDEVAKSRQFPMRFLSAWKAVASMHWGPALEKALDLSVANVPVLPGRTLVMIDVSGSMWARLSARSELQRWEAAGIFGLALAKRAEVANVYAYDTSAYALTAPRGGSILRTMTDLGRVGGGGTNTFGILSRLYQGHDRVVILTDEQAHAGHAPSIAAVPLIYTANLAGYRVGHMESGQHGRYVFGGLSDALFEAIPLIEARRSGQWPF